MTFFRLTTYLEVKVGSFPKFVWLYGLESPCSVSDWLSVGSSSSSLIIKGCWLPWRCITATLRTFSYFTIDCTFLKITEKLLIFWSFTNNDLRQKFTDFLWIYGLGWVFMFGLFFFSHIKNVLNLKKKSYDLLHNKVNVVKIFSTAL